jgi:hypothetical protein
VPLAGDDTNNQHTENMGKNSKNTVTKSVLLSTTAPLFVTQRCQTNTGFVANHFSILIMILLHEDGVFLL